MVDKTLILRKLAELEEYLGQIREFSSVSAEAYSGDWKTRRIVERTLQIMIELCIDIAGHIIIRPEAPGARQLRRYFQEPGGGRPDHASDI